MNAKDTLLIIGAVMALHVVTVNVLYPKILGDRLRLNPFVLTLALLLWGWLWGGVGLLLAIPITATMKIVFDHIAALRPYGTWMGTDSLRSRVRGHHLLWRRKVRVSERMQPTGHGEDSQT
jgi:Predicted permease